MIAWWGAQIMSRRGFDCERWGQWPLWLGYRTGAFAPHKPPACRSGRGFYREARARWRSRRDPSPRPLPPKGVARHYRVVPHCPSKSEKLNVSYGIITKNLIYLCCIEVQGRTLKVILCGLNVDLSAAAVR